MRKQLDFPRKFFYHQIKQGQIFYKKLMCLQILFNNIWNGDF